MSGCDEQVPTIVNAPKLRIANGCICMGTKLALHDIRTEGRGQDAPWHLPSANPLTVRPFREPQVARLRLSYFCGMGNDRGVTAGGVDEVRHSLPQVTAGKHEYRPVLGFEDVGVVANWREHDGGRYCRGNVSVALRSTCKRLG